jgi:Aft1 osmotic stress response (OSM) domain/Aft1 HRA domain
LYRANPPIQFELIIDEAVKSPELPVTTKLDQEPNPFEQSFSGAGSSSNNQVVDGAKTAPKLVLPPAAAIASPSPNVLSKGIFPKDMAEQFAWDSLRSGPLSPSMLQRPADPTFSVDGEQLGTNNRIGSISNVPGAFSFQGMTPNTLYGTSTNPQEPAAQYQGKLSFSRYFYFNTTYPSKILALLSPCSFPVFKQKLSCLAPNSILHPCTKKRARFFFLPLSLSLSFPFIYTDCHHGTFN